MAVTNFALCQIRARLTVLGGRVEPSQPPKTWNGRWVGIALVVALLLVTLPIIVLALSSKPVHATGHSRIATTASSSMDLGS
jgi:hypothetical protein